MSERKTVRSIVKDYLEENGYSALYNEDGDCACLIDGLMPCDSPCDMCRPAIYDQLGAYVFLSGEDE